MRRRAVLLLTTMVAALVFAGGVALAVTKTCAPGSTFSNPCTGSSDNDTITGTTGEDVITALEGADVVRALEGSDFLEGGPGNDTLDGGAGYDYLTGDTGNDTLDGGADGDRYSFVDFGEGWGADTISADASGDDYLEFSEFGEPPTPVRIYLTPSSGNEVQFGTNTVNFPATVVIENAFGWEASDDISGNDAGNFLRGGGGNDTLRGRAGADYLYGGRGRDTLDGGSGDDFYYFVDSWGEGDFGNGWGVDTISADASGFDSLMFSGLKAAVRVNLSPSSDDEAVSGTHTLNFPAAVVMEHASGGQAGDTILGNELGNVIYGNEGNDTLKGKAGLDNIIGGPGNDALDGGEDRDDYIFFDGWGVDTISADASGITDRIAFTGLTSPVKINLVPGPGNEAESGTNTLNFPATVVMEYAFGGQANDDISGNAANNVLRGGKGNDTITGRAGKDRIFGDEGNDTIFVRDNEADTIVCGPGTDTVFSDRFDTLSSDCNDPVQPPPPV